MGLAGKSDYVIQEFVGCGRFQVVLNAVVWGLALCPAIMTVAFMQFGLYNPGWTCLDQRNMTPPFRPPVQVVPDRFEDVSNTTFFRTLMTLNSAFATVNNQSLGSLKRSVALSKFSRKARFRMFCARFTSCKASRFKPEASTIITEWGLMCDKMWILRVIIVVQFSGVLVGSLLIGHLGDSFGRKKTIIGGQVALAVFNCVSLFSNSWQMFAAVRFFASLSCSGVLCLYFVFTVEFHNMKWRGILASLPMWTFIGTVYSLVIFWLKDWRHIHIVIIVLAVLSAISMCWIPESLRWLEVKNKREQFMRVASKISRMNEKRLPSMDILLSDGNDKEDNPEIVVEEKKRFTMLDLFRRGYFSRTLVVGLLWFTNCAWYYGISFGVKSLYGDFFINLIIVNVIELPFNIFPLLGINFLGRRFTLLTSLMATTICFLLAAGFRLSSGSALQQAGVNAVIIFAKGGAICCRATLITHTAELYPTVVRSLGQSWGDMMARVGAIVSPFLIPRDPESAYVSYLVMTGLGVACFLGSLSLPETKGKPLKQTFADKPNDPSN